MRFYFVVKLARSPKLITLSKVIRFSFAWLNSEFYYVIIFLKMCTLRFWFSSFKLLEIST